MNIQDLCDLLSGGTLTLCGHPDKLLWCGYKPVTWPVPSQPGVGHLMSFLSVRGESGDAVKQDFTLGTKEIRSYCGLSIATRTRKKLREE